MNFDGSGWLFWLVFLPIGLAYTLYVQWKRARLLEARYWSKPCTGRAWKKQFPDASKHEIRAFLDVFIDAFGFKKKQRLNFSPDDKVMDIYRTIYFDKGLADCFELESLMEGLEKQYGVPFGSFTSPDTTLGEMFAWARRP